jgi:hypothetical protein
MRQGKSEVKHPVTDLRTLRWAGEYADYIQRPQKKARYPLHQPDQTKA